MSSRRKFLQQLGSASVLLPLSSLAEMYRDEMEERMIPYTKKYSANDTIRLACIGTGIMGHNDVDTALKIPGVELVEMNESREECKCCGGGGNLEMVRPELSAALAQAKIEEIKATGADTVITACQQCVRTIQANARRKKIPITVMDIIEFVLKNMNR